MAGHRRAAPGTAGNVPTVTLSAVYVFSSDKSYKFVFDENIWWVPKKMVFQPMAIWNDSIGKTIDIVIPEWLHKKLTPCQDERSKSQLEHHLLHGTLP